MYVRKSVVLDFHIVYHILVIHIEIQHQQQRCLFHIYKFINTLEDVQGMLNVCILFFFSRVWQTREEQKKCINNFNIL